MKTKLLIPAFALLFISLKSISQSADSIRTKNDKPGTPQSLRVMDNTPLNRTHVINEQKRGTQKINHGATENNRITEVKKPAITDPAINNNPSPATPVTIAPQNQQPAAGIDSTSNISSLKNGQGNASNPTRK